MTKLLANIWPDYTRESGQRGSDLIRYKKELVAQYGEENIQRSWIKICKELEVITDEIAKQKSSVIPEIKFADFQNLTPEKKQELQTKGCFVVRQVVSQEKATEWFKDLKQYIADNKEHVSGKMITPIP
jgi:hypothetical protein